MKTERFGSQPERSVFPVWGLTGFNACSSHYINQKVLKQIVLTDIRCKAMWAQNSRETLRT